MGVDSCMGISVKQPSSPSSVVMGLDRTGMETVEQFNLLSCFCFRRPNGPNQNNVRSKCASPVKPRAKILTRTWAVSTLKRVLVQGLSGAAGREKIRQRARAFTAFLHPIQSIKYRPDFSYPVNPFCQGHFLTYQLSHHPGTRISLLY